jgi:prepilin peptidase CpaA
MNVMSSIEAGIGLTLAGLLLWAALTDFWLRRVENRVSLGIAALWFLWLAIVDPNVSPGIPIALATATLALGFVIWSRGWLGGGDVKLLAAMMLWAGPAHGIELLAVTAVVGGLLAVVALWYRHVGFAFLAPVAALAHHCAPRWWGSASARPSTPSIPYAVGIAIAGVWIAMPIVLGP